MRPTVLGLRRRPDGGVVHKVEPVNGCRYRTREEAKADVFDYIETYYNAVSRHSTLNYLSGIRDAKGHLRNWVSMKRLQNQKVGGLRPLQSNIGLTQNNA